MADAKLTWSRSPSLNVNQYLIAWMLNGTAVNSQTVPADPTSDVSGYSTLYSVANPTPLNGGDQISGSIEAVDTVNNLTSTAVSFGPVTVPVTAPSPPENVSLTLV